MGTTPRASFLGRARACTTWLTPMMRFSRTKARARKVSPSFPTCLTKRCFGIPRARALTTPKMVNAYALYGMELASTTKASTGAGSSSLASQASASAAPEVSTQELVKAVFCLSTDKPPWTFFQRSGHPSASAMGSGAELSTSWKFVRMFLVKRKRFHCTHFQTQLKFTSPTLTRNSLFQFWSAWIILVHMGVNQMLVDFGSGLALDGIDDSPEV